MRPEPFFSGLGIDRADLVRTQPERLAELVAALSSRQLVWAGGLPAIGDDGRLQWQPVSRSDLFLGIADGIAHFSATEQPAANARAAFDTMGMLSADEAPLFASALSLLVAFAPSFLRKLRRGDRYRSRRLGPRMPILLGAAFSARRPRGDHARRT